jgi:hypothetical protein
MTRKDYELIAASIHRTRMSTEIVGKTQSVAAGRAALRLATIDLAATLAHDNPRFDKARFTAACGF